MMRNVRYLFVIFFTVIFSVGPTIQFASVHRFAASLLLAGPPTPALAQTPAYRAPRLNGHPDLNGVWQAMNAANWDLLDHPAQPGPTWQTGAIGAVPAGQSVVEGGEIPYKPEALKKKQE